MDTCITITLTEEDVLDAIRRHVNLNYPNLLPVQQDEFDKKVEVTYSGGGADPVETWTAVTCELSVDVEPERV